MELKLRPCDRCGAGTFDHDEYNEKIIEHPLCSEFQMAYGVIAWLCLNCRKDWLKVIEKQSLNTQFTEAQFRLEFWRARVGSNTPEDAVEVGLQLVRNVAQIERQISLLAHEWLVGD